MEVQKNLIDYVSQVTKVPKDELDGSVELYSSSNISSLKLLELMSHIEKTYKIIIKPEEFVDENFKNIEVLSQFIESKLA